MPSSFAHLAVALAASTAVVASPVDLLQRRGKTFSVQQVEGTKVLKNGPAQVAKTYQKFGQPVPQYLIEAVDRVLHIFEAENQSGSVTASPSDQYDSSYLCPVNVGGTTLNLDFDTGSSDLWVFSNLLPAADLNGHEYYTVKPANQLPGFTWDISYGDGSGASGTVYADKVVIGGVTATSQAVEAATSVSSQFVQDTGTDGLVGLAMNELNTVEPVQQTTFFSTVLNTLAQPLFAADLRYHAAGSYDFGFIDTSKYSGSLNYVTANTSQGWWGVDPSGYSIGGSPTSQSLHGILDTGTTLVYTADDVVEAYYSKVPSAQNSQNDGGWVFSCNAELPDFGLIIGGVTHTVPGKYINYAPSGTEDGLCFGGIQSQGNMGFGIYGDIFLKSQYVVFEMGTTTRIGLAQQA